jgi:hypothetical protein
MGSVGGVLHVVPADFVSRVRFVPELSDDHDMGAVRNWTRVRLNDERFLSLLVDFDRAHLHVKIVHNTLTPIVQLALVLNKNDIGLGLVGSPAFPDETDFAEFSVPVELSAIRNGTDPRSGLPCSRQSTFQSPHAGSASVHSMREQNHRH